MFECMTRNRDWALLATEHILIGAFLLFSYRPMLRSDTQAVWQWPRRGHIVAACSEAHRHSIASKGSE